MAGRVAKTGDLLHGWHLPAAVPAGRDLTWAGGVVTLPISDADLLARVAQLVTPAAGIWAATLAALRYPSTRWWVRTPQPRMRKSVA